MINLFKKKAKQVKINLEKDVFYINDVAVSFPTSTLKLYEVLGKPSRSGKTEITRSTIDCWDDLGIYTDYASSSHILSLLLITGKHPGLKIHPKTLFSGEVLVKNLPFAQKRKSEVALGTHAIRHMVKNEKELGYSISWNPNHKKEIPKDYYTINIPDEEVIEFKDFGFKLSIIQELMYHKALLQPKFDVNEFVDWYDKRTIDIEKEGYEPIPELTQYFKDLPIPKRFAKEVTEIYQDGGNDIYLQLLINGEGYEDYWDIKSIDDLQHFPHLKKATLCYAKEGIVEALNEKGVKARWL